MSLREKFGIRLENTNNGSNSTVSTPTVTVEKKTYDEWLTLAKTGIALQRVPKEHWTNELITESVLIDPLNFKYLSKEQQTKELTMQALSKKPWLIQMVSEDLFDDELCVFALGLDPLTLEFIPEQFQTYERCLNAVQTKPKSLKYVPRNFRTPELLMTAVQGDGKVLEFVDEDKKEYELCVAAVRQDVTAFNFVAQQTVEIVEIVRETKPDCVNWIKLDDIPVSSWNVEWFKNLTNVELRRSFIKERGKEVFNLLDDLFAVEEDNEYVLVKFKYGAGRNIAQEQRALIYECPSSSDVYFTEVAPDINTIKAALKFLNSDLGKEELAYES